MSKDLLYKVAYDEAVRALSEQQAAIDSVRSRAGMLLSASAVTTSFLGAEGLRSGGSHLLAGMALLCFVSVAGTCLVILLPRKWEFAVGARWLVESWNGSEEENRVDGVYRDLSLRMRRSFSMNHQGLVGLAVLFQAASALLTIEVLIWIAAIALDL